MTTTHTPEDIERASLELLDAMEPTPKDAADTLTRYADLKAVRSVVIETGEILDPKQHERELKSNGDWLRDVWLPKHGPTLYVEGIGEIGLTSSTSITYDARAIYAKDRALFERMLEMGVIEVSHSKAAPHLAGELMMLKPWGFPLSTPRLTPIKRDGAR